MSPGLKEEQGCATGAYYSEPGVFFFCRIPFPARLSGNGLAADIRY